MRHNANNLIIVGSSFDISSGAPNILSDQQQAMWCLENDIGTSKNPEYAARILATETFLHLGSIATSACAGAETAPEEYPNPYSHELREVIHDNFSPDSSLPTLVSKAIELSRGGRKQISTNLFQSAIELNPDLEAELAEKQHAATEIIEKRGQVKLRGYKRRGTGAQLKLARQELLSVPYYTSFSAKPNEIKLTEHAIEDLRSIAAAVTRI